MQKINPANFISTKIKKISSLRIQDGFLAFDEQPSDKYDQKEVDIINATQITVTENSPRINATDLFSLFTANIIKEKVLFCR